MTDKLKRGADCIGLTLLDHIIVTRNGHFSFVDHGLAP
jgi:DNA repair protein RadC